MKIEHPCAIAAWALCVMEDVHKDVRLRLKGAEHDAIEEVIKRLHLPPCPNKSVDLSKTSLAEIVDTFWNEFKAFQCCTEPFHHLNWCATPYVSSGISHIWHEKYSLPYTQVLGYVACGVTSKLFGIGPAERGWAAVKTVKNLKKSHLGGESTEKRSVIYITAKQQEVVAAVAVWLGHVVSADLVQAYCGADVGSNTPTDVELRCTPHHLINVVDPPIIVVVVVVNDVVISYDTILYS
jgi:hypothetical protein